MSNKPAATQVTSFESASEAGGARAAREPAHRAVPAPLDGLEPLEEISPDEVSEIDAVSESAGVEAAAAPEGPALEAAALEGAEPAVAEPAVAEPAVAEPAVAEPAGAEPTSVAAGPAREPFADPERPLEDRAARPGPPLRLEEALTDPTRRFRPPAIPGFRSEVTQPLDAATMQAAMEGTAPAPPIFTALSPFEDAELKTEAPGEPPAHAIEAPPVLPSDEELALSPDRGAAEGLFGDEPEAAPPLVPDDDSDEGDPLSEKTVDLEIPRALLRGTDMDESALSTDESATVEGAPLLDEGTDVSVDPPEPGSAVPAEGGVVIRLEESLGDQRGAVFFRARIDGEEQPFTAVWSADPPPEPPWSHIPDPRVVRPRARANLERAALRVFERPRGNTVVDYLGEGHDRLLPAMATLELGIELAEILESLHGAGQLVYDLDPSQIVIERGGRVRLYAINGLYAQGRLPEGPLGVFVAPEVRRRLSYLAGQHSDVYAVALMIYALLAKRSPIGPDLDPSLLPNPRVFRPECPLGIWPYLQPCLAAAPGRRIGHARGLRAQLEKARQRLLAEARAADAPSPIVLEAWAELHTGLGKARRGADQQDRALSVTDQDGNVGLYIIADGVSRSRYGDGAFAAEQVEASALLRWTALEKAGPAALALSHAQRADVLRQISRSAGKRISQEVNQRYAPLANEPNQVMSATLAAAFIVNGEATVANLGDSRGYLIRDGTIERITIDHDRATDALRMGLGFREAADVRMGAALTRVVGRVVIDEDGSCRPDPFDPEIFRVRLLPGDRLLLCSDGVPDFAAGAGATQGEAEQKMLACVLEHEDPARAAYELVVLANRAGGYDNISCVVIAAHAG